VKGSAPKFSRPSRGRCSASRRPVTSPPTSPFIRFGPILAATKHTDRDFAGCYTVVEDGNTLQTHLRSCRCADKVSQSGVRSSLVALCVVRIAERRESYRPRFSNMSTRLSADDATLASTFLRLRTFNDVAVLLDVNPKTLRFYLHKANNYKAFTLRKRCGGFRAISSPVSPLRIIQRKLNQVLHAVYRGRSPVHGFVRGFAIKETCNRLRLHLHALRGRYHLLHRARPFRSACGLPRSDQQKMDYSG